MSFKKIAPSMVSLLRIPLGFLVCYYAVNDRWVVAYVLLAGAEFTDALDGWLAIRLDARSHIGAVIDTVCDICMSIGAVAGLVLTGTISWSVIWVLSGYILVIYGTLLLGKRNRLYWFCCGINPFAGMTLGIVFTLLYMIKTNEPVVWVLSGIVSVLLAMFLPRMKPHHVPEWWGKLQKAFPKNT